MENLKEKLKEDYLRQCAELCRRGYSNLSFNREKIKKELISKYGINENKNYVSGMIKICEEVVFDFLDGAMSRGSRSFGWPDYHEQELRNRLSTALQEA
jgi:hypothetical protein